MNEVLFIRKWVEKEKTLEADVIQNILAIKKLRKFQDSEAYWDLITACWKLKNHVDRKQKTLNKRWSKIDIIESIDKTIPIHAKKREISNAFYEFANALINELKTNSESEQRKRLEIAEQNALKHNLNRAYKLWTDIYVWDDEEFPYQVFNHMETYIENDKKYSLRNSIYSVCSLTDSDFKDIIKYLMNQFAKKNKELFESNQSTLKNN